MSTETLQERQHRIARQTRLHIEQMGRDPMCVPQLAFDPFRMEGETYAQALRGYIEFVHTDELVDPNNINTIY